MPCPNVMCKFCGTVHQRCAPCPTFTPEENKTVYTKKKLEPCEWCAW